VLAPPFRRRACAGYLLVLKQQKWQSVAFSENPLYRFDMRIALLTFCLVVTVAGTAQARLGETPDQLVARYGQPLSEKDQKGEGDKIALADVVFEKGGFQVSVTVVDGLSVAESFKKLNGQPITTLEVRTLLTANGQGHEWDAPVESKGGKLWTRDDSATAYLGQDGSLQIKSPELVGKEVAAKRAEKSPTLDGF